MTTDVPDEVQRWTAMRKAAAAVTLRTPTAMGGAGAVKVRQQSRLRPMQTGWTK